MLELLRRYGVLLLIALAMTAMYFQTYRPAFARSQELRRVDHKQQLDLERLCYEARRMEAQLAALRIGDPVLLERAVRGRFAPDGEKTGLLPSSAPTGLRGP